MVLRLVSLPIRLQRRLLVGLIALLGAGLAATTLLWVVPLDLPDVGSAAAGAVSTSAPFCGPAEPLEAYAALWQRDLQQPLYDAPAPEAPAPPRPAVTLLGTAIDPGFTYGIFQTAGGESKLASVGQCVDGAVVVAISADSATLRLGEREYQLNVVRKEAN